MKMPSGPDGRCDDRAQYDRPESVQDLARADRLSLLEALYGQVLVPSQVHDEILRGIAAGYDVFKAADESTEAEWMALTMFENRPERTLFKSLLGVIGYGEAAGTAIAKERDWLPDSFHCEPVKLRFFLQR